MPSSQNGYADVQGGKIYFETKGNPQDLPVVLIHAGFLDRRLWDEQFELFPAEGLYVIRYDMRGLGRSSWPKTLFEDASDLHELLNYIGVRDKVCLVGLSNGGSVALDFCLAHPDRVRGLILVAPTVQGYEYEDEHEEKLDRAMDGEWQKWQEAIKEDRVREAVEIHLGIMAPVVAGEAKEQIIKVALENYRAFKHDLNQMRKTGDPPAFKRLAEIKVPTLLIWGDRDYPGQISLAERVHRMIPQSKRILVHGADHLVNVSQPGSFNRVVLNFIRSQRDGL